LFIGKIHRFELQEGVLHLDVIECQHSDSSRRTPNYMANSPPVWTTVLPAKASNQARLAARLFYELQQFKPPTNTGSKWFKRLLSANHSTVFCR
jgi:hypothetical protein